MTAEDLERSAAGVAAASNGASPGEGDVVGEIVADARRRRDAGEHPAGLDRELDETYRRLVRHRPGEDRLTRAIWAADAAAHVSADAGLAETPGPAKRFAKRVLAKLVRWYILRVTSQVTNFANAATSALRLLSDRVEALAEEVEASRPPALPGRAELTAGGRVPGESPLEREHAFAEHALGHLRAARGRVLHADCRSGAFVERLAAAGVDAYGVDPSALLVGAPAAPGLDLVQAEVLGHLRNVPSHGLGGAVLSGCVDRLATGDARRLAFLLGTRVATGGPVVLVGTHPAAWRLEASPLERDLAPGRPLHPETWSHLLAEYGITDLETVEGPDVGAFSAIPGSGEAAQAVNAHLEALRRLLGGPASFIVAGTRAR